MTDQKTTGGLDDLLAVLTELAGEHPEAPSLLKDVQVMQQSLLQHEALRLAQKYGPDHPRTQQLQARLQDNLALVQAFEATLDSVRTREPAVTENGMLLHGRAVDENQRGVAGLTVSVEDEQGKVLRSLGRAETDASGYYTLPVDAHTVARLGKSGLKKVFLVLRTARGVVRREPVPLTPVAGERTFVEVSLNREALRPRRGSKRPAGGEKAAE
jgi:hypothetical protein